MISDRLKKFAQEIDCTSLGTINSISKPTCMEHDCHNNVNRYIWNYGGINKLGYHFIEKEGIIHAILHSIVQTEDGRLLDITPPHETRIFGELPLETDLYKVAPYIKLDEKNQIFKQSRDDQYFVYALCDPRKDNLFQNLYLTIPLRFEPFYIGKGKLSRPLAHIKEAHENGPATHPKHAKILSIEKDGFEPYIRILRYFWNEQEAYDFEANMISQIGGKHLARFGIKDGPLTNLCPDNRPPNQKGRTYEEIMGKEKADALKQRKNARQKAAGGYGPKQQTKKTRQKISDTAHANYKSKIQTILNIEQVNSEESLKCALEHNPFGTITKLHKQLKYIGLINDVWGEKLLEFKPNNRKGKTQSKEHKALRCYNSGLAKTLKRLGISDPSECTDEIINRELKSIAPWEQKLLITRLNKYGLMK